MFKSIIILSIVLSFSQAQNTIGVASFLKRGFSPKWSSLEGSSVIFVDGASSLFLNPSGLVSSSKLGFIGSYVKEKVFSDVDFQQLGMHYSNTKSFGIGFCFSQARVSGIEQYDEHANYIGSGIFNEWVALVGMAYSLTNLDIGISNIFYQVDNLGQIKKSEMRSDKARMILGVRYHILDNLNVGVVVKNRAELLPNEYMEGEKRIGIGYSYYNSSLTKIKRDLFSLGISYSSIQRNGLISFGLELLPLENLSIRGSYSNIEINSNSNATSKFYKQKISFGLGYVLNLNEVMEIDISYGSSLHTYPSFMDSFTDPLSKNDMVGICIRLK